MRQLIRVQVPAWAPRCWRTCSRRPPNRRRRRLRTMASPGLPCPGAVSSVWSERLAYTEDVGGSSPSPPTNFLSATSVARQCGQGQCVIRGPSAHVGPGSGPSPLLMRRRVCRWCRRVRTHRARRRPPVGGRPLRQCLPRAAAVHAVAGVASAAVTKDQTAVRVADAWHRRRAVVQGRTGRIVPVVWNHARGVGPGYEAHWACLCLD